MPMFDIAIALAGLVGAPVLLAGIAALTQRSLRGRGLHEAAKRLLLGMAGSPDDTAYLSPLPLGKGHGLRSRVAAHLADDAAQTGAESTVTPVSDPDVDHLCAATILDHSVGSMSRVSSWNMLAWASNRRKPADADADIGLLLERLDRLQTTVTALENENATPAVDELVKALEGQERAAVWVGSLLVVKLQDRMEVTSLTRAEIAVLRRNPDLLRYPERLLQVLRRESGGPDQASSFIANRSTGSELP